MLFTPTNSIPAFTRQEQLDNYLNGIARSLQLPPSAKAQVKKSYDSVSAWIESDPGYFKEVPFEIYPQGSFALGTTVLPTKRTEFDLDFVVHLRLRNWMRENPLEVLDHLYSRIKANGTYKPMAERKNRCVRLNYANSFHMDIMPGTQELLTDLNRLMVPDRKLENWTHSNPKGYTEWFRSLFIQESSILLERAYAKQDLPKDPGFHRKQPIQRAVQVIKRYRDLYFEKNTRLATSSIILTTLIGYNYRQETSIYETIDSVVNKILGNIDRGSRAFEIPNPANLNENFADKWVTEPELFDAFKSFVREFSQNWQKLSTANGIHLTEPLTKVFGDLPVRAFMNEQANLVSAARGSNNLLMDRNTGGLTSSLTASSIAVSQNTFFGA